MTSLQRESCLLALGLYRRNCSVFSVKPPTNTSGGLVPSGLQLQSLLVPQPWTQQTSWLVCWHRDMPCSLGRSSKESWHWKSSWKSNPDPVALLKSNLPQTIKPEEASGNFVFIAWFVLSGAEFNSCSWELKKRLWKNVILIKKCNLPLLNLQLQAWNIHVQSMLFSVK